MRANPRIRQSTLEHNRYLVIFVSSDNTSFDGGVRFVDQTNPSVRNRTKDKSNLFVSKECHVVVLLFCASLLRFLLYNLDKHLFHFLHVILNFFLVSRQRGGKKRRSERRENSAQLNVEKETRYDR